MDNHLLRFQEKQFLFYDFETFNLNLHDSFNLPWQIGMIKVKGNKKIADKNIDISWERELNVGKEAARITRFSPSKYKKLAVPYDEIFPTIKDWLDNADYIIGHNILGFDIYLIKDYYQFMGEDYNHLLPKLIDTNCIARGSKIDLPYKRDEQFLTYQYKMLHTRKKGVRTSLLALGKEYDLEFDPDNLHDALNDLELNIKVWNKIKWHIDI